MQGYQMRRGTIGRVNVELSIEEDPTPILIAKISRDREDIPMSEEQTEKTQEGAASEETTMHGMGSSRCVRCGWTKGRTQPPAKNCGGDRDRRRRHPESPAKDYRPRDGILGHQPGGN